MNGVTPLPARDRVIIALLGFFIVVAVVLELPWLLYSGDLPAWAARSPAGALFRIYGDADRAYYDAVTPLSLCLEGINVFFTQALNAWLIFAIVRRRAYRHALQLTVASYLSYSVILYFLHMQVGGFAEMRYRALSTYLLFYGVNAPWLLAHLYMLYDSVAAVTQRFRGDEPEAADAPAGTPELAE
jgi:hypothetical protein